VRRIWDKIIQQAWFIMRSKMREAGYQRINKLFNYEVVAVCYEGSGLK
jgi:hypothetical protein